MKQKTRLDLEKLWLYLTYNLEKPNGCLFSIKNIFLLLYPLLFIANLVIKYIRIYSPIDYGLDHWSFTLTTTIEGVLFFIIGFPLLVSPRFVVNWLNDTVLCIFSQMIDTSQKSTRYIMRLIGFSLTLPALYILSGPVLKLVDYLSKLYNAFNP